MASIVVSGFPNYLKRPGIVGALKKILKPDLIEDFWINEISEVYPDVLQANVAMCSVADASKAVNRLNQLPYYSKGCNYMLKAQVVITSERQQEKQFAAPNNGSRFGQNNWQQALDVGTPSGPNTFSNGPPRGGFDGQPQRNFNDGPTSRFDDGQLQKNFNSGPSRRFDDVPTQMNCNNGPSQSGFGDGPPQRNFNSISQQSGFHGAPRSSFDDGPPRSSFDDGPPQRNFNSGGYTSKYDDDPSQRNTGPARSGFDNGQSQRYNSGMNNNEFAGPTQSNFNDFPPRRSHDDECPRDFNSGAPRSGFDNGSAQMSFNNNLPRSEFLDGRTQGNFVDTPPRRGFDEVAPQRPYNDDPPQLQIQFNSQNDFSRRVVDGSQRQDFNVGPSRRIDDEPPRLDRSSGFLRNANPSDLDMEIEILRKQRLIIEEERKLLLEQKKLELVKEFGPGALDGLNNVDDLEPGHSRYGSFGGPRHLNAGPNRFSGGPKRFDSFPKRFDSGPKRFGNHNRFEDDRSAGKPWLNNEKMPPPTNKDGKTKLPMFFLPVKHIMEEIKPFIPQGTTKREKNELLSKIQIILRHRINVVLQNLPHKKSNEIIKLYRQAHPQAGDKKWVEHLLANVKRKLQKKEILKFQGEVEKLKEVFSKD